MESSNLNFDEVRRYLKDQMDQGEKAQFESRINSDPELAKQVDLDRVLLEGIQLHYRGQLKEKLKRLDQGDQVVGKSGFPIFKALALAAGFTLILVVSFFIFDRKPDTQALYAAYFKPYYNVVSGIERGELGESGIEDPYQLYESGQYQKANASFEKLLLKNPDDAQLRFYAGLSYLNAGLTAEAISHLSQVADIKDFAFLGAANWYLGLAYLKEDRPKKAIEIFKFLEKNNDGYATRADELLQELQ